MIGAFGSVTFEITNNHVFTPSDEALNASSKIETKEAASGKPKTIKSTPELRTYKFYLVVSEALGIRAQTMVDKWLQMAEAGTTGYMNMGGRPLSSNMFKLKSVAVSEIKRNGRGELLSAKLACDFQEQVGAAGKAKKKKVSPKKSSAPAGTPTNPYHMT